MSRLALLVALACAACGRLDFDPLREAADAPASDAPHVPAICSPDPTLVACWPFDGDTLDDSGHHDDATPIDVTFVAGSDGGSAVQTDAQTQLLVAESSSLDPTDQLTVEAWIYMDALPSGETFLFDNDDQYGLGLDAGGNLFTEMLRGDGSAAGVTSVVTIGLGAWHHVAMRYDATTTIDILIDGAVVGTNPAIGPITTQGSNGSRIAGDAGAATTPPFIGRVDSVRVWSVARETGDL